MKKAIYLYLFFIPLSGLAETGWYFTPLSVNKGYPTFTDVSSINLGIKFGRVLVGTSALGLKRLPKVDNFSVETLPFYVHLLLLERDEIHLYGYFCGNRERFSIVEKWRYHHFGVESKIYSYFKFSAGYFHGCIQDTGFTTVCLSAGLDLFPLSGKWETLLPDYGRSSSDFTSQLIGGFIGGIVGTYAPFLIHWAGVSIFSFIEKDFYPCTPELMFLGWCIGAPIGAGVGTFTGIWVTKKILGL